MNPPRIVIATHRSLPVTILFGILMALAAGCVYRPNIQQGNLLRLDDVNQVTVGMTRSQVRYLLGTPMVADPFHPDRWDYIYTLRRGRETKIDRSYFVVHFDGDKVAKVDKIDMPDASDIEKMKANKARQDGTVPVREPAPAPSVQPPPPGTPTPAGG
jgi:outer membrane protein assembly factor BamE